MKAAFFRSPGEVTLREVKTPAPTGRELLVRVAACGVCGSDLADLRTGDTVWHQLGHEYAGLVEAAGPEATLQPGMFVAAIGSLPCGNCWYCQQQETWRCPSPRWGPGEGFSEYVCGPEEFFFPAPELTPHEGALVEPLTVAMDLVDDGGVERGARVCVIGLGPIGLMALRLSRLAGAERVYVMHPSTGRARVAAAHQLGADAVFHPDTEEVVAALRAREPRGVDIVLATAPLSKSLVDAVGITAPGGTIAFVGMEWQPVTSLSFKVDWFHFQKLRLVGSNHNPCSRLYPRAVHLLHEKHLDASALVSHAFPLPAISEAFNTARDRAAAVKVMINVQEGRIQ